MNERTHKPHEHIHTHLNNKKSLLLELTIMMMMMMCHVEKLSMDARASDEAEMK